VQTFNDHHVLRTHTIALQYSTVVEILAKEPLTLAPKTHRNSMPFQDAIANVPFAAAKTASLFGRTVELPRGLSEPARSLTPADTEPALHLGKRLEHRMFSFQPALNASREYNETNKGRNWHAYQGVRVRG